jgi:TetR/AcrR family transcriptional regulator, transcriptional repressor for nem operon
MRHMVGRPREFDENQVLDAAMKAFWANGYEATSLADLVAVTGLHKGSLYQAFGDKHTLFVQTLQRYLHNMRQHKNQVLQQAETPLTGIRAVLHGFIDMSEGECCCAGDCNCPKGCMAVKSLVEMAPHDAEVQRIMEDHKAGMRASMEKCLCQAQADGELSKDKSPQTITALLLIFMDGLATLAAGPTTVDEAHALLAAQLDALL